MLGVTNSLSINNIHRSLYMILNIIIKNFSSFLHTKFDTLYSIAIKKN